MKAALYSWPFWALLSAFFAALTAIFGKLGVEDINPDFATFLRTGIVLAMLGGIVLITGAWQPPSSVPGRTWIFLSLSAAATGASWLCYYRALQQGPASGVAALDRSSVILVALIALAFLGERLLAVNWVGLILIALGSILVLI